LQNRIENDKPRLILASSSVYRKIQLKQLVENFECMTPGIDESHREGENAGHLAERLALAKAQHIAADNRDACVIGSDQVAVFDEQFLGKPGSRENARKQLAKCSGKSVIFQTAVAVVRLDIGMAHTICINTQVDFRALSSDEIYRYVEKDNPVDCAGSFKVESAGTTLFEKISSEDPTALVGLPLIATAHLLRRAGFTLP
jgi:septum formation protein